MVLLFAQIQTRKNREDINENHIIYSIRTYFSKSFKYSFIFLMIQARKTKSLFLLCIVFMFLATSYAANSTSKGTPTKTGPSNNNEKKVGPQKQTLKVDDIDKAPIKQNNDQNSKQSDAQNKGKGGQSSKNDDGSKKNTKGTKEQIKGKQPLKGEASKNETKSVEDKKQKNEQRKPPQPPKPKPQPQPQPKKPEPKKPEQKKQQEKVKIQSLDLGVDKRIKIGANKSSKLKLKLVIEPKKDQTLFITAESPYNDPFQEPTIKVTSTNNFQILCSEEEDDFIGICQIENEQLAKDREFIIQFTCEVDCNLLVSAYLSDLFQFELGQTLNLQNPRGTPTVLNILLNIPKDSNYSSIFLLATPSTQSQPLQQTIILANYGPNPKMPSISDYQSKAQTVSNHRLGLFLSNKDVRPGQKIMCNIFLANNSKYELISSTQLQNQYQMVIGTPIYDFISDDQPKIYILDLAQYEKDGILNETLRIKFQSYAGRPTVTVSLDKQFKQQKIIMKWRSDETHTAEITPYMRQKKGQEKKIYIKVQYYLTSNYQIGVEVNKKNFLDLDHQEVEIFELDPLQFQNFIFVDENELVDLDENGEVEYRIQLKSEQEDIKMFIRDCGKFKKGDTTDCIITDAKKLEENQIKKSFSLIQPTEQQYFEDKIYKFRYNVKNSCQALYQKIKQFTRYRCEFHIFIRNQNKDKSADIEIQMNKNSVSKILTEGNLIRDSVKEGEYNYYSYQLSSIDKIRKVLFYVTVAQGDVTLLLSKQIVYPTIDDLYKTNNDIKLSMWNSILLQQQNLVAGTYHIAVKGDDRTDYRIGVAIQKWVPSQENNKDMNTQQTQIQLIKGIAETITIPIGKQSMSFVFTPQAKEQNSIIKVIQIQGDVQFKIIDKQHDTEICSKDLSANTIELQCQFQSSQDHQYLVKVSGNRLNVMVFSILYTTEQVCDFYPWNFPIEFVIPGSSEICISYKVYQMQDIHIYISLSSLEMLSPRLDFNMKFGQKSIQINGNDKYISKKQLSVLCKDVKQDECFFQLNVKNLQPFKNQTRPLQFFLAAENYHDQNVLFEGIPFKTSTKQLSPVKPQRFYYYIFDDKKHLDISILLTSESLSKYQIAAKVVGNTLFSGDANQQLYPSFNEKKEGTVVVNSSQYGLISYLSLKKGLFDSYTVQDNPVVLISVFGLSSNSLYTYNVELSQGLFNLYLGQTKTGNVYKYAVFQYNIDLYKTENTSIQIRSVDDDDCVISYIMDPKTTVTQNIYGIMTFFNEEGPKKILIRTISDICTYQISFYSLDSSVVTVHQNIPYEAFLYENNKKYLTYYHNNKDMFYVLQMISSGNSKIYVESIKDPSKQKIADLIKKQLGSFSFISQTNGDLQISKQNQRFCSNCFYLIAVQGQPTVKAEILINPGTVPILLKESIPLRDKILYQQTNKYQLYSGTQFILLLTLLNGGIRYEVTGPDGHLILNETFSKSESISLTIPGPVFEDGQPIINFFDEKIRYLINIKNIDYLPSHYYIQVIKKQKSPQAFDGIPLRLQLVSGVKSEVQFSSIYGYRSMNFLIEDLKYFDNQNKTRLKFDAFFEKNLIFINRTQSQSSYNIKFEGLEGKYKLQITSQVDTQIELVFSKDQINHLLPGRNIMLDKTSKFQLFSPGSAFIVQVFSCKHDLQIKAAHNLSRLTNANQNDQDMIRMQHSNYGGHYVVTSDRTMGQFFIQVSGPEKQTKYVINYHIYDAFKQKMPYNIYGAESQSIYYNFYIGGVEFYFDGIKNREDFEKVAEVQYVIYISNNTQHLEQLVGCSVGTGFNKSLRGRSSQTGKISFRFTLQQIKNVIGDSLVYFVTIQAVATIQRNKSDHLNKLYFLYDTVQLVSNSGLVYTDKNEFLIKIKAIALWVILPFLVASFILLFAVRYLIRFFGGYIPQLIEQQGQSEGNIQKRSGQSVGQI